MFDDDHYPSEAVVKAGRERHRSPSTDEERYLPSVLELRVEEETRAVLRQVAQKHFPGLCAVHSGMSEMIKMAASEFCCNLMSMEYRYHKRHQLRGSQENETEEAS
jgi:hypothetical protein